MIQYLLLISRQGKVRQSKWYQPLDPKQKMKAVREATALAVGRSAKFTNFIEMSNGSKLVCRRYASLYFVACVDKTENELLTLEIIHHYVEVLDRYFGNVCELDLIFNFHRAYFILDEVLLNGELVETSKKTILKYVSTEESLAEDIEGGGSQQKVTA